MKYYIYRSVPKIDMLWEQIDAKAVEKYSAELKVNFGLVSGGIKSQPTEKNLHAKLEIVLEHLRNENRIGDIRAPSAFVKGTMPMTWQELVIGLRREQLVLFFGYDQQSDVVVGLVGSAAYVTGMKELEPASLLYSQPGFWNRIVEEWKLPSKKEASREVNKMGSLLKSSARSWARWHKDDLFKHKHEFAAKTFTVTDWGILGSPLYVAEASDVTQ